jgi:DNA-binding NtrC family response regulator
MAQHRTSGNDLSRLLDAAALPAYALDARRRIVFLNAAGRAWLGPQAAELLGQECRYHSTPDEQGHMPLAGLLCPPPEVLSNGRRATATIHLPNAEPAASRVFDFIPLVDEGQEVVGVLALGISPPAEPAGSKPLATDGETTPDQLHALLQKLRASRQGRFQVERLVGESPALRRARAQASLAAANKASVLVLGPTGSGRQHVARAIHYSRLPEALGPLVPLACGLLGAELLQASIRGLARPKASVAPGRLATLLLNDADQMPPEAQAELAGFLRIGEVPVRFISTARRPLVELAETGKFRPDLACLLSTITIELPPLEERLDDLPLLAQMFLERVNAAGTKQLAGFTPEALDALAGYAWPRQLDELAEIAAAAHAQADGPLVEARDLPILLARADDALRWARKSEETIVLEKFLGQIERELIERALERAKGNKTRAAKLLGMTRPRLYRRLVQLGMIEEE